jgi:hypothetical protein
MKRYSHRPRIVRDAAGQAIGPLGVVLDRIAGAAE